MKHFGFSVPLALVLVLTIPATVHAHSWIDNLEVVGGSSPPTGVYGYIRNYQGHIDATSTYLISDPTLNVPVCAPFQSKPNDYPNPKYPPLHASPGDFVMGTYLENGHISKPNAPDAFSGIIYWFGTTDQSLTPTLAEVLKWTADSSLGNGSGRLLAPISDFDDGTCAEDNSTPLSQKRRAAGGGGPCKSTFKIPEDVKPGQPLTVFWVWDFSSHFGPEEKNHVEWYTSCADIDIVQIKMAKRPN